MDRTLSLRWVLQERKRKTSWCFSFIVHMPEKCPQTWQWRIYFLGNLFSRERYVQVIIDNFRDWFISSPTVQKLGNPTRERFCSKCHGIGHRRNQCRTENINKRRLIRNDIRIQTRRMLTPRGSSLKKNEPSTSRAGLLYSSESSTAGSAEKRTRIQAVEKVKQTIFQSSSGDSSDVDAFLESQKRTLLESEKQRNTNINMKTNNQSVEVVNKSNINNLYPILESLPEESSPEEHGFETDDDLPFRFFKFICCL